ncbi:MAG: thioesterase family protein [Acidobacteriia bacterium]|nr:thioesterase family protein [Terriglobia bacterium]
MNADPVEAQVRVRYVETDQMSVAHHANYLAWFEVGRTEWCRAKGFTYRDLETKEGILLMVAEVRCRYKSPARYDDVLTIRTQVNNFKKRLITFGYEILNAATREVVAAGESVHVVTDRNGRVRSLPEKYVRFFS